MLLSGLDSLKMSLLSEDFSRKGVIVGDSLHIRESVGDMTMGLSIFMEFSTDY